MDGDKMERERIIERLMGFGLTKQESTIYLCLLTEGKLTGYEAAKLTGISRSNAYGSLAGLNDKGAAYSEEEAAAKKYIPVPLHEFCENYLAKAERDKHWLEQHITCQQTEEKGYITIEGNENIMNKVRNLLKQVDERVYVSCESEYIKEMQTELNELTAAGKKVVVITNQEPVCPDGVKVYIGEIRRNQIGVIADSKYVLTGEYGKESNNTCLYSGQRNFVELYKNALSNEIKLIEYQKGELQ
ncbi:MAG: TrmB family transcriptional regulator [Lachnospiraceae bacterium]